MASIEAPNDNSRKCPFVQRCRNHEVRNVVGHLAKKQDDQARVAIKAEFKLSAQEGQSKMEQYAT